MSIPTLTPLETPIFDDDVIAEMEQHVDEVLACCRCVAEATSICITTCCKAQFPICPPHLAGARAGFVRPRVLRCATCREVHLFVSFDDTYRVVDL
ncbi:hypothetical protein QE377_002542 [Microbacterium sp. SORGH_AS 862]|nr:hypothetical protein [Microbacterium sp. SORGH_AS_0862]